MNISNEKYESQEQCNVSLEESNELKRGIQINAKKSPNPVIKPRISIQRIQLDADLPVLTRIMKEAFDDDARRFNNRPEGGGPPGYDDGSFLTRWVPQGQGFKAIWEEKNVGGMILFPKTHQASVLGCIFVDPQYQNKGIGSALINFMESTFPNAKAWELDTPSWAVRNHHFYEKNGFRKIREIHNQHENLTAYIFRKDLDKQE